MEKGFYTKEFGDILNAVWQPEKLISGDAVATSCHSESINFAVSATAARNGSDGRSRCMTLAAVAR